MRHRALIPASRGPTGTSSTLCRCLDFFEPIPKITEFLCRSEKEVCDKIKALKLGTVSDFQCADRLRRPHLSILVACTPPDLKVRARLTNHACPPHFNPMSTIAR